MRTALPLLVLALFAAAPLNAAHYHLKADGTGAYATIQAAVNAASSGDTIICADGTYSGTGNDGIDFGGKNLKLKSESNQPKYCIISCSGDRGFHFHSGETNAAVVQGFTIRYGSHTNGGGICIESSSPTIINCVITDCNASNGGGIYVANASSEPNIFNCLIEGNSATNDGGGLRLYYSNGQVKNCTIANNSGDYGGGISSQGTDTDIINCIIYGNIPYQLENAFFGLFSYNLVEGWTGGGTSFNGTPDFAWGTGGDFYLNQATSDALNAGNDLAVNVCATGADGSTCLSSWTTNVNQQDDAGQVDVGYHYPHYSATIDVPTYKPTIQAAIDAAWNGDNVRVMDGTYTGDGNRDLDTKGKRITVQSYSTNASACIIDCQGSSGSPHRGFYIRKGEGPQTIIKNLKIINGWSSYGGGINITGCSPTIQGCILSGNHASVDGGGIMNSGGFPDVIDCTFIGNSADDAGGGMMNHSCAPALTGCLFEGNSAVWGGGGLYNYYASPSVEGCTFRYNTTSHWGGGAHNQNGYAPASLTYNSCVFQENTAIEDGGAMYNRVSAQPYLTLCTFTANEAGRYGAGIYCNASIPHLDQCTLSGNGSSTDGGGMYCTGAGEAWIQNTVFAHNMAERNGGGFYGGGGENSAFLHCTFYDNSARQLGGGMYGVNAIAEWYACILWDNTADIAGAQLALSASEISVGCCDVQGGQAGIYTTGSCTISWGTGNIDAVPLFCDAAGSDLRLYNTSPCAAANSGGCGLIGALDVGCTATDVAETTPAADRLHQSFPNPFNPTTRIAFDVAATGPVSLRIYDVSGRLVRTIIDRAVAAGRHNAIWDGTNDAGSNVASGTYFCRMTAGNFSETRKLVLLR